jgi:hypothetical protein
MNYLLFFCLFFFSTLKAATLANGNIYQKQSRWYGFDPKTDRTQFILCRIDSNNAHNPELASQKVFFDEGSDTLAPSEEEKIKSFFKGLPNILNSLSISAYADQCGDKEDNLKLSQRRADNVKSYLDELINIRIDVPTYAQGDSHSQNHSAHDRFVEITTTASGRILSPEIENIYLIDGSASMNSSRTMTGLRFNQIKNFQFKPKSMVFVVRAARLGCRGSDLKNYSPAGNTFIREAQALLAINARGNLNIISLTDEDQPLSRVRQEKFSRILQEQRRTNPSVKWFTY